ncbi:MAG: SUMF1/EgtB/PvdO family nonheme iron enzyme [Roseiflexaceae bacterium]|nr:SUMF1/EgtB/PvdO family nonheme iron enzyme [Roseiflexaceae bacterium]
MRGGRYRIGGWERGEPGADVLLRPFWIARVPIIVAQYRAFMEDGGYARDTYWTPHGRAWKREWQRTQPWLWDEPQYTGANQPVIGVSWYEAMAFCAWLQEWVQRVGAQRAAPDEMQRAARGETQRAAPRPVALPEGYAFRLPTEAEWEVAAAYDSNGRRRTYPWGDDKPTPERAFYDQPLPVGPEPVGSRPAGAAACSALDMAGDVWEVTASQWDAYPVGSAQRIEDVAPGDGKVPWRGGSWWSSSTYVRCGARVRLRPGDFMGDLDGFRIVVAPHSH